MSEIVCAYCGEDVDIDTSEMYNEDNLYEVECDHCGKWFGVRASHSWTYFEEEVDCWNGADHKWKNNLTAPREYGVGKQACQVCDDTREIDKDEWEKIEADDNHPQNWRNHG